MKFKYEDLSSDQFEELIVLLCQRLLGISVQGFAVGRDGGRDARFEGTAELHPSKASPWTGRTIIQAKHTYGFNKYFAESDFFSLDNKTCVIAEEIPRIKKLRANGELDNYMLFSNRRLTGGAESDIRQHIASSCEVATASIYLCGVEQLESWFKTFKDVPKLANLDLVDSPLIVGPEDLAEIVEAFARQRDTINAALDTPPTERTSYSEKNELNNMSDQYAKEFLRRNLKEAETIRNFLSAPENQDLMQLYESTVAEFQLKIIAHRKEYQTFDQVMNRLMDVLFERDALLRQRRHKSLTHALLFYMYWNCDIGKDRSDVAAN